MPDSRKGLVEIQVGNSSRLDAQASNTDSVIPVEHKPLDRLLLRARPRGGSGIRDTLNIRTARMPCASTFR